MKFVNYILHFKKQRCIIKLMSVELHVGSTSRHVKVAPAEAATDAHLHDSDIHVTPHETKGRTGAPTQPMRDKDLRVGAITRVRETVGDVMDTGGPLPDRAVFAGAECGVVFDVRKLGFVSKTVAAVVVFDRENGTRFGIGEAGGVRYPTRDVLRSWASRGKKTIGQVMSERLGGDPQDPHAMLGKGTRVDQVRAAYASAFDNAR